MAHSPFGMKDFVLRWLIAFILVSCSYNATGYSISHWLVKIFPGITPIFAVFACLLIIGWAIFIRATVRSLGTFGLILMTLLVAAIIWLFVDMGLLSLTNLSATSWLANLCLTTILAVGISWSHVRRRISGQVDVDDVQD
jgi:hypothetical protein